MIHPLLFLPRFFVKNTIHIMKGVMKAMKRIFSRIFLRWKFNYHTFMFKMTKNRMKRWLHHLKAKEAYYEYIGD
jgi:hypothetical protein